MSEDEGKMAMVKPEAPPEPPADEDDEREEPQAELRELSADDLINSEPQPIQRVALPELGGFVRIREWTGVERDAVEAYCDDRRKGKAKKIDSRGLKALFVVKSVCDESGTLQFNTGHIEVLNSRSAAVIDRIASAVCNLNHITANDEEELLGN